MLRSLLPARVVVSLLVAFAFVGLVVAVGALFRDRHDSPRHRPPVTATASPATTRATGG